MRIPIIVSAILPLVVVPESSGWLGILVGVSTWIVFLVDYVVHLRHTVQYRRTGYGRFDLIVVIATAPWFLLPGLQVGRFAVFLRLARIGRIIMATKGSRRLFDRLGRVGGIAAGVTFFGSLVAYYAEHPTNPEFATFGDSLWWGVVTLTTVGYGDIVPKTATGRWAAVCIMVTGVTVLGVLAGSLSSFFRIPPGRDDGSTSGAVGSVPAGATSPGQAAPAPNLEATLLALTQEVAALRGQVEELAGRLSGGNRPTNSS
jgi:voltage-gated potassium channel